MLIGQVIGEVTATRKHPSHEGLALLLVQPLELDGSPRGNPVIAVDSVGAGAGDRVLVSPEGFCAMSSVGRWPNTPLDMAVLGIIDEMELLPEYA